MRCFGGLRARSSEFKFVSGVVGQSEVSGFESWLQSRLIDVGSKQFRLTSIGHIARERTVDDSALPLLKKGLQDESECVD